MRCNHPLRTIRAIANDALAALTADFDALYSQFGRPSIPPEQLLRAMLLQAFYGIRSERQLMERIEFDLLFRWFTGLGVDDPVWDHSTFSKNRDRLLEGEIAAKFLQAVLAQPKVKRLVSNDHFSVDGTLLEAWASMKSFRKTDGSDDDDDDGSGRNGERNFHGEKRSNKTHRSTTDPDAKLYRKGNGQPAKLCYLGHALMENRNGLAVGGGVTQASGTAEREAALNLVEHKPGHEQRCRFLVTSLDRHQVAPRELYEDTYCPRGDMENRIKDCQLDLFANRMSAHAYKANQLRLLLAAFAYVLIDGIRRVALKKTTLAKAVPNTIRLKLLKLGAKVINSVRRIKLSLPDACPYKDLFFKAHAALAPP